VSPSLPPADLDDLYDRRTLAALDAQAGPESEHDQVPLVATLPGWRRSVAGTAVLTGVVLGLREVFAPEPPSEAPARPAVGSSSPASTRTARRTPASAVMARCRPT